jgi:glucan biosynthesis protein C
MILQNVPKIAMDSKHKINGIPENRLLFIDNLRWVMIVFVVLIHLNCTYGNIGRWYYQEAGPNDVFSIAVFGVIGSLTQAYFMGLLFFIAGLFVPGSCDKKGAARFILDRSKRLGIPALIYMALLHPITVLIIFAFNQRQPADLLSSYQEYLISANFFNGSGPLWFALALLIFSMIYAFWRLIFPKAQFKINPEAPLVINNTKVIILIGLIALLAFTIRLAMPIGTAFFNMQLCYFGQYVVLFPLGIFAYRRNLLTALATEMGEFWFKMALRWGILSFGLLMIFGGAFHNFAPFTGGFHWQAAAYAIWESFFCIGICLGLLVLFRDKYNTQGKLSRFLSENSFGVYVFHTPLLVTGTMLVRNVAAYPLLKMILMALVMLPICFGFSHLLRKAPLIKQIFS